jgi:hypothetical protein
MSGSCIDFHQLLKVKQGDLSRRELLSSDDQLCADHYSLYWRYIMKLRL